MNEANKTVPRAPKEIKLTPADEVRFWKKVNKDGPTQPHMESPCWVWTACKTKGYGRIKVAGVALGAHRFAWAIDHDSILHGDEISVMHRCDNPSCCRASHLQLGTHADNMRDMITKGRHAKGDKSGARTKPECLARGEHQGSAKLTESKVVEIRAIYAAGGIIKGWLAKRFGVSRTTIDYIIRRKKWKHI